MNSLSSDVLANEEVVRCVHGILPQYGALLGTFTTWEKASYYLNVTTTASNNPRVDDFDTRLVHDIIAGMNQMDPFLRQYRDMLENFQPPVETLEQCLTAPAMASSEQAFLESLRTVSSYINSSYSLTDAINQFYIEISEVIRNHPGFQWLQLLPQENIYTITR